MNAKDTGCWSQLRNPNNVTKPHIYKYKGKWTCRYGWGIATIRAKNWIVQQNLKK